MRWLGELALGGGAFAAAIALCVPAPPRAPEPPPASANRTSSPKAGPARPYTASYTWRAELDPATHRIRATGTIEFANTSNAPLQSLFFHLYLNAFKNDRTLFLRSPFGAGRAGLRAVDYGYVDVKRLAARELGGLDLWPGRAPHSPSDPEDETDIEVPLPRPLEAGARLTLDVTFEAQLPSLVERTGHRGDFHLVGQWFPKLARLEPDGRFEHFSFHPQAEFYADFGRYDVTLVVPETYVVGATGNRVAERRERGQRIERYVAEPVHDFAWTAWDRFLEHRTRIGDVNVRLLYPPGHERNRVRTEASIAASLPYFSRYYGPYPYPNLTVVHPPEGAEPAGGMEYPTLITTGGSWYLPYTGLRTLEAVTVHELGHQWFYGLLASNEAKAPFLDEGLTSFAEMSALSSWLGPGSAAEALGWSISTTSVFRAIATARASDEAIAKPAAEFSSFQNLGALVYGRVAILMETLGRVFGREPLERALQDYAASFRFGHPTATDLLASVRTHMGERAALVLERALFDRGTVNFLVRELRNANNRAPAGYFERASGRERVVAPPDTPSGYRASATIHRHGSLELPIEILLVCGDGTTRVERWDGRGAYHTIDYSGASPLVRVVIDPERKVLIDDDLLDNQVTLRGNSLPRTRARLGYWAALGLSGITP